MSDLVCILFYRDADVEIRSREDWMRAPARDLQLVLHRWPASPGAKRYVEVRREQDAEPDPWDAGAHFWIWREDQPRPFACDRIELADHLVSLGITTSASSLDFSLDDLARAGVKYGLNLATEDFERVYRRAKHDRRIA